MLERRGCDPALPCAFFYMYVRWCSLVSAPAMNYVTLTHSATMVVPRSLKVSTRLRLHGHTRHSLEAFYSGGSPLGIALYLMIEYEKSEHTPATDAHTTFLRAVRRACRGLKEGAIYRIVFCSNRKGCVVAIFDGREGTPAASSAVPPAG